MIEGYEVSDAHVHYGECSLLGAKVRCLDLLAHVKRNGLTTALVTPLDVDVPLYNHQLYENLALAPSLYGLARTQLRRDIEDVKTLIQIGEKMVGAKFHPSFDRVPVTNGAYEGLFKISNTLFNKYISPIDVINDPNEKLINLITNLGLMNRKSLWIKSISNIIQNKYQGIVPNDFYKLIELPGVGNYVANAVRCFGFGESLILFDVNSTRIFGRLYKIGYSDDQRKNHHIKKYLNSKKINIDPKIFNWAIMDLGAIICKKRKPNHLNCPLKEICETHLHGDNVDARSSK